MKSIFKFLFTFLTIFLLFSSCAEKRDPFSVTTHPEGWTNSQSSLFHGAAVIESNSNLANCTSCHGLDYAGGTTGASCTSSGCHSESGGPEACNTCHGNEINPAPPEDLYGNTGTTVVGVGAHQSHLMDTTWTTAYQKDCILCHIEPTSLSSPGHIDDYPYQAEINFSSFASNSGISNPLWNHDSETCNNVYCHGGFAFDSLSSGNNSWAYTTSTIDGNNPQMNWTSVGTGQTVCGSCHGLPPIGHIPAAEPTCVFCHPRVVDGNLNIIDKSLHINGRKEIF
jgi:CxxxxCH...CXXCH motif protein